MLLLITYLVLTQYLNNLEDKVHIISENQKLNKSN